MVKRNNSLNFGGGGTLKSLYCRKFQPFRRIGFTLAEGTTHVDTLPVLAKAGFTLVEILITLGIIGIVAAMTIPGLITNVQKTRTANELKKAFAEISAAVKLAENEYGDITGWTYDTQIPAIKTPAGIFDTCLAPFMKISKKEVRGQDLIYYRSNNQRETGLAILNGNAVSYTLLSGAEIIVTNRAYWVPDGFRTLTFILDLNGYGSKPNRFGRDAFYLAIYPNIGAVMHYDNDGEYGTIKRTRQQLLNGPSSYRYQCNSEGRGMWCGALIQKDGWKIAPDYPWN